MLSFLYLCGVGEFTLFIGYVKPALNLNHFFHYTTLASGHTGISSKPKQPLLFSLHKSLTRESSLRQPKSDKYFCDD